MPDARDAESAARALAARCVTPCGLAGRDVALTMPDDPADYSLWRSQWRDGKRISADVEHLRRVVAAAYLAGAREAGRDGKAGQ